MKAPAPTLAPATPVVTTAPLSRRPRLAILALASLAALVLSASAQAQVSLNNTFSFNMSTGLYTYTYGVTNNGTLDLALVDINVIPNAQIANLVAPTGFFAVYDPGVNLVTFGEDADFFTPQTFAPATTVTGFSFTSRVAPGTVAFTALDANFNTSTGTTRGPVPEPTTVLWGAALSISALVSRKRRTVA